MTRQTADFEIRDLCTHFFLKSGTVRAVDGVSFKVAQGEVFGLVGESGSGKTITGLSILGLVPSPGKIVSGSVLLNGVDLTRIPSSQLRKVRGRDMSMIFQDAMTALNPVLRVDTQMVEAIQNRDRISKKEALKQAVNALERVGIPAPEKRLKSYPHQFSGGMRQRLCIAIAMINHPKLVIADEPTTALDVTIQSQILHQIQKLCRDQGSSVIWISHDLAVVAGLADQIGVMYAGKIVEMGPADTVLDRSLHPYTAGLINSVPSGARRGQPLEQIPGSAPSLANLPEGCAFKERCSRAGDLCKKTVPMRSMGGNHWVRCHYPGNERQIP